MSQHAHEFTADIADPEAQLARLEASWLDPQARVEERARVWLAREQDERRRRRLRLVVAFGDSIETPSESAAREARDVLSWARERDDAYVEARCHRLLSMLLGLAGDPALSLEHAVRGLELLGEDVRMTIRCDHVLSLADGLAVCRSFDEARARYLEAELLARRCDHGGLLIATLNNLAYTEYEADRAAEGVAAVERLLAAAARYGRTLDDAQHSDTIAAVYLLAGRLDDAAALLCGHAQEGLGTDRKGELVAAHLVTLAQIRRRQGDLQGAAAALDRCERECAERDLPGVTATALRERSELHAATGDFEAALAAFKAFHALDVELRDQRREAQARTLQAVFETSEARRESERHRELSSRDPLTGLRNRRFVDEWLASTLTLAADAGQTVTIAFVDLDHFKHINDTHSHDVGDEVLRGVAALLDRAPVAVAARMGGEEFLLALVDVEPAEAVDRLESVRAAIAAARWDHVVPGLGVTASMGVVHAPTDGGERRVLLALADRRLYLAKQNGRNRLQAAGTPTVRA